MNDIAATRSILYLLARILGDINSMSSPRKFVKRQARKIAYRKSGSILRKLLK